MDHVHNLKNLKRLRAFRTKKERLQFMCGGRVTVVALAQLEGNHIARYYAAKIRGLVVGDDGEWLHTTPEAARQYGRALLAYWRTELAELQANE